MSNSRGAAIQQVTQTLQSSPELVQHDTQIRVAPGLETNFEIQATTLGAPSPVLQEGFDPSPEFTVLEDLEAGGGRFFFGDESRQIPEPGNQVAINFVEGDGEDWFEGEDGGISLSEEGIGVFSYEEMYQKILIGEDGEEVDNTDPIALNDDEFIGFDVFGEDFNEFIGFQMLGEEEDDDDDYEPFDPGITGLNIQFEVLNDEAGSVDLFFANFPFMVKHEFLEGFQVPQANGFSVDIAEGQKGTVDNIGFFLPDIGAVDVWDLSVDGDVNIAITGIDFSTNFEVLPFT